MPMVLGPQLLVNMEVASQTCLGDETLLHLQDSEGHTLAQRSISNTCSSWQSTPLFHKQTGQLHAVPVHVALHMDQKHHLIMEL